MSLSVSAAQTLSTQLSHATLPCVSAGRCAETLWLLHRLPHMTYSRTLLRSTLHVAVHILHSMLTSLKVPLKGLVQRR